MVIGYYYAVQGRYLTKECDRGCKVACLIPIPCSLASLYNPPHPISRSHMSACPWNRGCLPVVACNAGRRRPRMKTIGAMLTTLPNRWCSVAAVVDPFLVWKVMPPISLVRRSYRVLLGCPVVRNLRHGEGNVRDRRNDSGSRWKYERGNS